MNNKRIIFVICLTLMTMSIHAQKKVYWIHGFNESSTFWERYRTTITPYNMGKEIQWYSSITMKDNAEYVNFDIRNDSKSPSILIGHSAGGLISRSVQKLNDNVKGIITVGTPNKGAGIADALKNNSLNNVGEDAINRIEDALEVGSLATASSVTSFFTPVTKLITSLISAGVVDVNGIADIGQSLANKYIDEMKSSFLKSSATADLLPSSDYLKNLNSSKASVPIINIYGNEYEKRLVRIASSAYYKDSAISLSNVNDKQFDDKFNNIYKSALGIFTALESLHYTRGTIDAILGIFYPPYLSVSSMNFNAASKWASVQRFIEYDVHNDWSQIIGAVHYEKKTYTTGFLWWKKKHTKYVPVYENHDGFIPNKSSMMEASMGVNIRNREVKGVNHMEMSSHPDIKKLLREILFPSQTNNEYHANFNINNN